MRGWRGKLTAVGLIASIIVIIVLAMAMIPPGAEPYLRVFEETYQGTRLLVSRPEETGVPALIVIHGGEASSEAAMELCVSYAERLLPLSVAIISVDYRESSIGGEELEDVLKAIDYAKTRPYINPNRICLLGVSHGGYLALMAAVKADVKCVIDAYGPTSLKAMTEHARRDPGVWAKWSKRFLQMLEECKVWGMNRTECMSARSPLTYAEKINEDVLIMHGLKDETVPASQSILLASAFDQAGKINYVMKLYDDKKHGFSLLQGEPYKDLLEFLAERLELKEESQGA